MNWDLIIFDCDGVLVDSEPIAEIVFPEILAQEGFPIPPKEAKELFTGYSIKSCIEIMQKRFNKPAPLDLEQKYYSRLFIEFKKSLKPIPGIKNVLESINYPVCVASSGSHEKMNLTLGLTGLLHFFKNNIFSAADVKNGKPYPDLFLHAAEKLNARPEKCAVIEDSIPGVRAGISAEMTVFGYINKFSHSDTEYTNLLRKMNDLGAKVFFDMNKLPGFFQ
ncbi:MAG: HAD family phosphatase [Chitinispirillia bacterium]|jgi:phosphoglycolate phosphatase